MYLQYIYGVFQCIYNVFQCIWKYLSVLECIWMYLEYIWMYLNVFRVYLNVFIIYLNIFECTYNIFVVYFNVPIRVFFFHFFWAVHKAIFTGMMKRLTSMRMNETSKIWMKSQLFIQMYAIHSRMSETIPKFCCNWAISSIEKGKIYRQIFP
jgi:hypothetical protein